MLNNPRKKRILIFSLAYHPVVGGAEIAVKEITDRLPDYEFDMITKRFDMNHPREEKIGNVTVHRIESSKILFPIEASLYAKTLHGEREYDAIWSIMAAYAGFAALFFKMKFPEIKYILTLQEGDPLDYMKKRASLVSPLFTRIFTKANLIQAISNYLADYARAMGYGGRVEVIPNGVDSNKFSNKEEGDSGNLKSELGIKEGDKVLITTSRLVKKNGISDVIESLVYLPKEVKFLVLGTGPLLTDLELEVIEHKLEDRVKFIGHVPYEEIPRYLHVSDVFIRPSLSEGFGNSFIEAMAAGLPVIATQVGGIVDFLFDPDKCPDSPSTGLFVKVNNPESIALQVKRLLEDNELKDKLVINAEELVKEKYDWNLIAGDMGSKVFSIL